MTDLSSYVDNTYKKSLTRNKKLDLVVTKQPLPSGDRILTYDHIYEVKKIGEKLPEDTASAEFIGIAMFSERGTEVFKNEYHKALEDYMIN